MLQDRTLLEQNLIRPTLEVKRKRSVVRGIKQHLAEKYSIFDGSVQSWINDPTELQTVDTRLLFLFAEQIYLKTGDLSINPADYFTPAEIKASRQFNGKLLIKEDVEFPLRFQPAIALGHDSWSTKIDIKYLVALLRSRLLNWNPETQREATYRVVNGEIIEEATLYMENVMEMKNLLKQNKLEKTQITLNCGVGTSDSGNEVTYYDGSYLLEINKGTKIDIIDGFHRIKAAELALGENPELEFEFELKILNLTVPRAAQYLAQISKRTPISETKRKMMAKETFADMIIDELRQSEIGERISKKEMLSTQRNELVTYNKLADGINRNFKMEKKADMYDVADYLIEFFDVLLGSYEEEFTTNYHVTKDISLLVENNIISYGFTLLAARMKQEGITARNVRRYVSQIDFDRNNPMWIELGVLDSPNKLAKYPRKGIEEVFSNIKL